MAILLLKNRTIKLSRISSLQELEQKLKDNIGKALNIQNPADVDAIIRYQPQYALVYAIPIIQEEIAKIEENSIEFKGINNIKISYTSDIAVSLGLNVAFIQPWYIKPVNISITGHSYLGTYSTISKSDDDVEKFYSIYYELLAEKNLLLTQDRMEIRIANNPKGTDIFRGFVSKFDFEESVSEPFVLKYSIEFVGSSDFNDSLSNAELNRTKDLNKIKA